MIAAVIESPGLAPRPVVLTEGRHVFGGDLASDVVVLGRGMPDSVLALTIFAEGVTVEILAADVARIAADGTTLSVAQGTTQPWTSGERLTFCGTTLSLRGGPVVAAPEPDNAAELARRAMIGIRVRSTIAGLAAMGVLYSVAQAIPRDHDPIARSQARDQEIASDAALPIIAAASVPMSWFPVWAGGSEAGAAPVPSLDAQQPSDVSEAGSGISQGDTRAVKASASSSTGTPLLEAWPTDPNSVAAVLSGFGVTPSDVTRRSTGWVALVHVRDMGEKDAVNAIAASLPDDVALRVVADPDLVVSAGDILAAGGHPGAEITADRGHLRLEGVAREAVLRSEIEHRLKRDLPTVRSVTFADASLPDEAKIIAEVAGIWAGPRPYVLMRDGRIVRRGQKLSDQIELVDIRDGAFVLRDLTLPGAKPTTIRLHDQEPSI